MSKKNRRGKVIKFMVLGVVIVIGSMVATYAGIKLLYPQNKQTETYSKKPESSKQENNSDTNNQEEDEIDKIIDGMTTEEKVAQMFMVRVPVINRQSLLAEYQFGGYMFFSNDFEGKSKQQIIDDINGYQSVSKIPIFIGTDEEGGEVNRLSTYFLNPPFPSPQALYADGGWELISENTASKDQFLKSFGINVNFAPVADISVNPNDYIYDRTIGKGASETESYVQTVVSQMKKDGMGSVVKHFPGYGNNANTHTSVAYDNRPYSQFEKTDFLPFEAATQSGVDCILVSHNVVESIDAKQPASLSPKMHDIIRNTIGFDGVIITDDLSMEGVSAFGSSGDIAVQAILAGNDMLLSSDAVIQSKAVLQALNDGKISMDQIDRSVYRILAWKQSIGLLNEVQ